MCAALAFSSSSCASAAFVALHHSFSPCSPPTPCRSFNSRICRTRLRPATRLPNACRRRAKPSIRACATQPPSSLAENSSASASEPLSQHDTSGSASIQTLQTTESPLSSSGEANAARSPDSPETETDAAKPAQVAKRGFFAWLWSAIKAAFSPGGFAWGLAAGVAVSAAIFFMPDPSIDASLRQKVTLFDFILQDINSSYVDRVDLDRLFETGVNSMLGTLDPYTQFENNAEALEMSVRTSGRYAGVGLGISASDAPDGEGDANGSGKVITVVSAFEGYAFDAGVRPGDVIESVGGKRVDGMTIEAVTDMLRGEPGTAVQIAVKREGFPEPLRFTLQRRSVQIRDVPVSTLIGNPENGIGYIRLQSFAKDAAAEVRASIQQLVKEAEKYNPGRALRGLVLDLRGNPGGLLNAAIEVSESIVPKNSVIVSTKGRGMAPGPTYRSTKDPVLPPGLPLAVLVNGQTASASEIVAGAVQDLDLGVVVGSRTFGKGLVQNVQELPYQTALKYTVGKYYTPSGRCIQALNYQQGGSSETAFEAKQVEEGQRKEFKTRLGRSVRDGGGIEPDVTLPKRVSFLELALQRQNMFFRFANRYAAEMRSETLPDSFVVTDGIYRDFVKFVTQSKFKYESRFDDAFDQLDSMLKDVGYDAARGRIDELRRATESEMKSDFMRHEQNLRAQLESAIRYRFQPDSSRIKAELRNDQQLAEAVRVLRNPIEYAQYLSPAQTMAEAPTTDDSPADVAARG